MSDSIRLALTSISAPRQLVIRLVADTSAFDSAMREITASLDRLVAARWRAQIRHLGFPVPLP